MTLLTALIGTTFAANAPAELPTTDPQPADLAMQVDPPSPPAAPAAQQATTAPAPSARPAPTSAEAFTRCYRARLAVVPELAGKVTVRVEIAADGSVRNASTVTEEIGDQPFLDCLVGAARQLRYAAGAENRVAQYPLAFATE